MEKALQGWSGRVIKRMGTYPPQMPTTSGYVRKGSGGLGGGWKKLYERKSGLLQASVENSVPYAVYVVGDGSGDGKGDHRAREMERRNWPLLSDVAKNEWPTALGAIEKAIADSIND